MQLWSSASYEPHLLSLPFAIAPAAMLVVIAYTAVMRGAPILRAFLLAHCLALLPYGVAMMLSPSITSPEVAEQLFRIASALIPMAAACGSGFQIALIRQYRRRRAAVWFLVANAALWLVLAPTTDILLDGIEWRGRYWFPVAGPWTWIAVVHTLVLLLVGFVAAGHVALTSRPSDERRQLRAALLANFVTYASLIDVGLTYGIGGFPIGWLMSGIGSVLVVRALVVEDLLRIRAVDTTAPMLVLHVTVAALLSWAALAQIPDAPWWIAVATLALCWIGVRKAVATATLVTRGGRGGEGPLERLLAQLVSRARTLTSRPAIAQLTMDIVDLGVGVRPTILLASEADWGWTIETAAMSRRLDDELAPDPFLTTWIAEHRGAHPVLFAGDLEPVPADLRELYDQLFERHAARAIIPIRSADEVLGLIAIPAGRRVRGRALDFVARAGERLAEALLHARMAQRAAERAGLAREVELAATVQAALLPGTGPHVHGNLTVVGSWRPATHCAGDFWGVYPVDRSGAHAGGAADHGGRVLIVIGDVAGHGVASAMVTAAAVGACDVYVRRAARADLTELMAALDVAVRRVGGGVLAMTCFGAILDPATRTITYVSCGHTAPYLCRPEPGGTSLHALVGRGNPLGAGVPAAPRVLERTLEPGDLVVWYTDGVIEAKDPAGKPYGDRRLQHLLKRLDGARLNPTAVLELVQAGLAAHRAGRPLADDETVVVAGNASSGGSEAPPREPAT